MRGLGRRVEVRQVDLSEPQAGAAVVGALADALGGIDALVNNAGTGTTTPFLELDFEEWRRVLTVDLDAAFVCAPGGSAPDGGRRRTAAGS